MVDELFQTLSGRAAHFRSLNARVKFVLGGPGDTILVDARSTPVTVERTDGDADCAIRLTPENLKRLMNGKMDPVLAFTLGKLKVDGSKGLAMKLASLLED